MRCLGKGSHVPYANFDLYNADEGAQSILRVLRLYKEGKVDAAKKEGAWMEDKSIDVYVAQLISNIGDKELSKLVGFLGDFTGKKFHVRLKQQLLLSRKLLSLKEFQAKYSAVTLSGRFLADLLERVGIEEYFNVLKELSKAGIEVRRMSGVLKARDVIRMDLEQVRLFIKRHMEMGIGFSVQVDLEVDVPFDYEYPTITLEELDQPDWHKKLYWDPMAVAGRATFELVNGYLDSPTEVNRAAVYDHFASLVKAEFIDAFILVADYLVKADPQGELIMDILDIYVQDFDRISFTQGLTLCLSICENYDQQKLMDYIADLAELVEEDKKIYEDYFLSAVNKFSVPAIFRRYEFTKPAELKFAFKVMEKLSYSSNIPHFFMQYVAVYLPDLIDIELNELAQKAQREYVSQANIPVLRSIAETEPAANWRAKAETFTANGVVLASREWSTGVDAAIRTKNRALFDFAIAGYKAAPDVEVEYYLFHHARYLMVWGEPIEWAKVVADFLEIRSARGVIENEYLPAWMVVWMVRNAAERWMPTLEDFIEKFMYQPSAIDSKVLSALCEKYRVVKQTEEIRRVIGRFGSRVKGEADWALLVLARAYYEVRLPDMAIVQLEEIASRPVSQEIRRRAHSYGLRFSDPRVFDLFDLSQ